MDNGWDSRRPLLGCPFGPPSGVHSPAVPCSDPTARNSLKGCLNWVLLSVIGLLCCFDVLYYSADFSDVKPRFFRVFRQIPLQRPVLGPGGPKMGPLFVHPCKSGGNFLSQIPSDSAKSKKLQAVKLPPALPSWRTSPPRRPSCSTPFIRPRCPGGGSSP